MIIDMHTHTFPEALAARTLVKLSSSTGLKPATDGTVDGILKAMQECSVDVSVLLPVVTNPAHATTVNRVAAENNVKPGLISFGGLHPDNENYAEILKDLKANGIKGIKIHPYFQQVYLDDIRYKRIVDAAMGLDMFVVTHAGYDIGYPGQDFADVSHIKGLLKDVKPDKLILAHLGAWNLWEEVCDVVSEYPVYLDTAFSLNSGRLSNELFVKLVRLAGADHVFYGSDSPWSSQSTLIDLILKSGLTDEECKLVLGENAEKALGLK